jgi:hypothetical protein
MITCSLQSGSNGNAIYVEAGRTKLLFEYLESNYDPRMLEEGRYSASLKARIRGGRGHLSNLESALLLKAALGARLGWVALAHLSEENNHPDLALATHRAHVGNAFPIHLASRYAAGPLLEV